MPEINQEKRIEDLKQAYIEDEISAEEFDTFLDAALDGGPPFRKEWFKRREDVRRKRYSDKDIFLFQNDEYIIRNGLAVPLRGKEIDRTIKVTDRDSAVTADFTEVEETDEPSDEAKEKQDELREEMHYL